MPPNKRKINLAGREVSAVPVPITGQHEHFSEYFLEDGTVLKFKAVVLEILRVDDAYDPDGNPVYVVKSQNITDVNATDDMRKRP